MSFGDAADERTVSRPRSEERVDPHESSRGRTEGKNLVIVSKKVT